MLDETTRNILRAVRDRAEEEGISATFAYHKEKSHLMRIGNSSVSLSTSETLTRLDIEVVDGRKQGTHTYLGHVDSEEKVAKALDYTVKKAAVAKEKDYQPPADLIEEYIDESTQYDSALANLDPAVKVEAYSRIIHEVGESYNYSGSWSSGVTEQYLITTANSNEAYHIGTDQLFTVVLKHPEKKWEIKHSQTGWRSGGFSIEKTVEYLKSMLPVYENNDGFRVEPGDYTVLFGPEAIAEIIEMALFTGMSGRGWEEKQGWTAQNKPGDSILGENITLMDNPDDENTFMFGFDMSGKRRKLFRIIENGCFGNLMYDANSAAKYGKKATGHNTRSTSIVMNPGEGPPDLLEATKDMGRVLYIPALHYMNIPNRSKGIFTASSRFSAVLIEDGKIVSPIFSSRITDTFQNILCNVKVISKAVESVNMSNTYGRRSPVATSVPVYMIAGGVKITDCADSF